MAKFFRLTSDIEVSVVPIRWEHGDLLCYPPILTRGTDSAWHFEVPLTKTVKVLLRRTKPGQSAPLFFWWQALGRVDEPTDLPGDGKWNNEFILTYNEPFAVADSVRPSHIQDIDILRVKSATNEVLLTMTFHVPEYQPPKPGDAPLKPYVYDPADHLDSFREDGDKYKEDNGKHLHALLRQLRHRI